MSIPFEQSRRLRTAYFAPPELQRRGLKQNPALAELADRGFKPFEGGVQIVQPWCRWRGISTYLACVAYADRCAKALPTGRDLNLVHVTPGQFYSAGAIFFTQALLDNLAVWFCAALRLSVKGGERHWLSRQFQREVKRKEASADAILRAHQPFVEELNAYRQVWIHTLSGGSIPVADVDPFENPETDSKLLGVPIDPALNVDEENYRRRAEVCAKANGGRYLYGFGEFTERVFNGASTFYFDWLRFALDHIRP